MADYPLLNDYNFIVSNIGYVIEREPNTEWSITNMANHDYFILAYATHGNAHYDFNNLEYTVSKGDLIFFSKGFVHSASSCPSSPWAFSSVAFDLVFIEPGEKEKFISLANNIISFSSNELLPLFSELNHSWMGKGPGYLIQCRSIVMQILYLLIKEMNSSLIHVPYTNVINDIINMMQSNYSKTYSIEELANMSELSQSYFRKLFKQITGLTPLKYQSQLKINKAKDLLLSGEYNVSETAVNVGFDNIYYFSRMFKNIVGISPSVYMKK
ncbi:MAG: AraC family transcriptional regulator [Clostridiales bacterium]|nr:AraC family transcriptional regulator [Clostridiales bacterium]